MCQSTAPPTNNASRGRVRGENRGTHGQGQRRGLLSLGSGAWNSTYTSLSRVLSTCTATRAKERGEEGQTYSIACRVALSLKSPRCSTVASGKRSSAAEPCQRSINQQTVQIPCSGRERREQRLGSPSVRPIPALRIGESPIRSGTAWPVNGAIGDCSCGALTWETRNASSRTYAKDWGKRKGTRGFV